MAFFRSRRSGPRYGRRYGKGRRKVYRKKFTRSGLARRQRTGRMRHYFKRSWTGTLTLDALISNNPYFVGSLFRLNQLPDYTEFKSLFDNYKIHAIKFTFFRPSIAQSSTEADQQVRLHTVYDYDDSSAPSTINELMQYDNYKVVTLKEQFMRNGKCTRFFKPRTLKEIYRGVASTGYQPQRSGVIDCQYDDVPHYGMKWALEMIDSNGAPVTMPADMTLQYTITYYMSFGKTV